MTATKTSDNPNEPQNTSEGKQISDVAKPGKTPAGATSRPIVLNQRSIMKDPMVASSPETEISEESIEDKDKTISKKGKLIQPTKGSELVAQSDESAPDKKPQEESSEEMSEAEPTTTDTEPPKKRSVEEATVDAIANQMVRGKKKPTKEDEEMLAEIQKHIEEKTYFVPIGQVKKRRAKRRLLVFVVTIIVLACLYLLADAEIVDIGVSLPFDFL